MRISYLVVRLGELIPRIYFSITEGSTGFGFKATRLSFAWAGCLMDCIWSVWVQRHEIVRDHGSWTGQVCWGLVWPQTFLLNRKEKRKLGAGDWAPGVIPEDPWSTCSSQQKWNLPPSLCGLLALGGSFGSDSVRGLV